MGFVGADLCVCPVFLSAVGGIIGVVLRQMPTSHKGSFAKGAVGAAD